MTHHDLPNVRVVVWWCIGTWLSCLVGFVVLILAGNWPAATYAFNASICAAGWWLSAERWTHYRYVAAMLAADYPSAIDDPELNPDIPDNPEID